jgi:hypothetical protein
MARKPAQRDLVAEDATQEEGLEVPFDAYWRLRMDGATSRLKAVQQIVTHNPSRGTLAETLLREVIAEVLPQRYAAATGFIMDRPGRSNQIDIIVYDQLTDSPVCLPRRGLRRTYAWHG